MGRGDLLQCLDGGRHVVQVVLRHPRTATSQFSFTGPKQHSRSGHEEVREERTENEPQHWKDLRLLLHDVSLNARLELLEERRPLGVAQVHRLEPCEQLFRLLVLLEALVREMISGVWGVLVAQAANDGVEKLWHMSER